MRTTHNIWHLLTQKITKRISREENEELQQLLKEDSSMRRASDILNNSQVSLNSTLIENSRNQTWERIAQAMQKEKNKHRTIRIWQYAAVACVSLLIVGGFMARLSLAEPDMLVAINKGNQAQLIVLSDSSEVWLSSGAQLEYPENLATRKREVFLKGKAFFDIKKSKGRSFKVNTDVVQITVLGTRFDVKTNETTQITEVILESGSVKLAETSNLSTEVILKPGEMGTVKKEQGIDVCNVDVRLYTAWKDDYLNIESLMLGDVMFMLSQRYHAQIKIDEGNLKKEIFSGRFDKSQSLEEILNTIGLLIPLEYQKLANGTYVITHK